MSALSIRYSDEGGQLLYELATFIAIYTNPQVFYDLASGQIPEVERLAELQDMKDKMEELLH